MLSGAVMVAGTASGVGKSTISAALCRSLRRRSHSVAPFKAQNMSNHAAVTFDGGEIGRAQAQQARAAGVEPTVDMNPILLKPVAETESRVVVRGREVGTMRGFDPVGGDLRSVVLDSYERLRNEHSVVVAEGAGGAAEINLLDRDLVNLPFAAAAGMPAILVADIDRGGAFASAYGTVALLPERLRERIVGIVFNRFRGEVALLRDGIIDIERRTGLPVLGVLDHLGPRPLLATEDSLDVVEMPRSEISTKAGTLRVAAIRLPYLANPSDLDPLLIEPGLSVTWTTRPADVLAADLVVLPGSRATVHDLGWLRQSGLADALAATTARVLGLCAGYQMLGAEIDDPVESGDGIVSGLGLLPGRTRFSEPKIVRQRTGLATVRGDQSRVTGYEIRLGRPQGAANPFIEIDGEGEGDVSADGRIWATSLHGLLDSDEFRRAFLTDLAKSRGLGDFIVDQVGFTTRLDLQNNRLADWIEAGIDISKIEAVAATSAPVGAFPGW